MEKESISLYEFSTFDVIFRCVALLYAKRIKKETTSTAHLYDVAMKLNLSIKKKGKTAVKTSMLLCPILHFALLPDNEVIIIIATTNHLNCRFISISLSLFIVCADHANSTNEMRIQINNGGSKIDEEVLFWFISHSLNSIFRGHIQKYQHHTTTTMLPTPQYKNKLG